VFQVLTKLDYLLKETFLGLRRGGWMNWAAISTVTVLLFLFGLSLQTAWQLEGLLDRSSGQLEVVVYLDPGAEAETVRPLVAKLPEVTAIKIVSKEQAWASLVQELGIADIDGATQQLEGNPLVDELKVQARSAKIVPELAQKLKQLPGVDDVQYMDEVLKRLGQLNRGLGWVSFTITAILTLTAVAVITTTIRLIVMARRREIEIMQLVGATAAWIYLPFILQGVTFGVAGAAIAWCSIASIHRFLTSLLSQQAEFIQFLAAGLELSPLQALMLPLILALFGSTVGLVGSLFAVRRFALR